MELIAALFSLLLSSLIVSTEPIIALSKPDTAKVLSDLSIITRNTQHLSRNLTSFINSTGTEPFAQHFADLVQHINNATTDVNAVGSFNSTDSEAIASQAGSFTQAGINLIITLINNKPAVASAWNQSLVLSGLSTTNTETLNLFTALEDTIDENSFDSVSVSQEELSAAFTIAISVYS